MGWDDIVESDKSDFSKIPAGSKIRVHLLGGEPEKRVTHFVNNKPNECTGLDCAYCRDGIKKRKSFIMSVYNFDTQKEQKLEQGVMVYQQIWDIRKEYGGNLDTVDFIIAREGSGPKDTRYKVVPVPTLYRSPLADLKEKLAEMTAAQTAANAGPEVPF